MSDFKKIPPIASVTGGFKNFNIGAPVQELRGKIMFVEDVLKEDVIAQSLLNTPIYDNLIFEEGEYDDLQGNFISYDVLIINHVIIEVTQRKNIVQTQIQGREGTIKELVSMGDYEISIQGSLQNVAKTEQMIYPTELVSNFVKIMKSTRSLHVYSNFLSRVFEISHVVITDFKLPNVEGMRNLQLFNLTALSDVEFDEPELI